MPMKIRTKDAEGIATLTFDAPGAPVNTMTEAWQKAFAATRRAPGEGQGLASRA